MFPLDDMGAATKRLDNDLSLAGGVRENELRVAKLALLARRSNFNVSATVVNACLLCSLLYPTAPRIWLGVWGLLQLAGAGWAYHSVHKQRPPPRGTERGITRAAWTCTGAGVLLGSVVLLLAQTGDFTRFLVFITLGAMASAASTTLAPIPRAAQGYVAGALILPAAVMPVMNGAELAAAARKLCPTLPVLFMSGYDPGLLEQFEAHDVLQKPFTLEQLGQAVTHALAGAPRGAQPGKVSGFIKTVSLEDAADETASKRRY